jgi:hypothetical protein
MAKAVSAQLAVFGTARKDSCEPHLLIGNKLVLVHNLAHNDLEGIIVSLNTAKLPVGTGRHRANVYTQGLGVSCEEVAHEAALGVQEELVHRAKGRQPAVAKGLPASLGGAVGDHHCYV